MSLSKSPVRLTGSGLTPVGLLVEHFKLSRGNYLTYIEKVAAEFLVVEIIWDTRGIFLFWAQCELRNSQYFKYFRTSTRGDFKRVSSHLFFQARK